MCIIICTMHIYYKYHTYKEEVYYRKYDCVSYITHQLLKMNMAQMKTAQTFSELEL